MCSNRHVGVSFYAQTAPVRFLEMVRLAVQWPWMLLAMKTLVA